MIVIFVAIAMIVNSIFQFRAASPIRGAMLGFIFSMIGIVIFVWESGHWDGQPKWYALFALVAATCSVLVYFLARSRRNRKKL